MAAGFAHMASLVVQWTNQLHEDSDVHQDPSLPANVDESHFLRVSHGLEAWRAEAQMHMSEGSAFSNLKCPFGKAANVLAGSLGQCVKEYTRNPDRQ